MIICRYQLHAYRFCARPQPNHNLTPIFKNGKVLAEIRKGMHGLKQSGKIANEDLKKYLKPYGHVPTKHATGLWCHTSKNLTLTLIVADFGINNTDIEQAKHLIHALRQKYEIIVD